MIVHLKAAKGIGTPAARDTLIEGLKRKGLLEIEKKKLKASKLAMAVYALLRREVPEVLDPAATADMERRLDDILSAQHDADAVISALAERAAHFQRENVRPRGRTWKTARRDGAAGWHALGGGASLIRILLNHYALKCIGCPLD